MFVSKTKYEALAFAFAEEKEKARELGRENQRFKDENAVLREKLKKYEPGTCNYYCEGCKHLIVRYEGSLFNTTKIELCALDRKCKNYEESKGE